MIQRQILFVFDSNKTVGFGHQARCERLAAALTDEAIKLFCVGNIDFDSNYFESTIKHNWINHDSYDKDLPILIHESTYDAIIIDMRNKNHSKVNLHKLIRYFEDKHSLAKRVIIDEASKNSLFMGKIKGAVRSQKPSILVVPYLNNCKNSYNIVAGSRLFIGSEYALIDDNYRRIRNLRQGLTKKADKKTINLLVSFGRSNIGIEQAKKCIQQLKKIINKGCMIYANLDEEINLQYTGITVESAQVVNVGFKNNMPDLLDNIDIAIVGSGTIRYETCALGIPTLCFIQLESHIQSVMEFQNEGLCKNGGRIYEMRADEINDSIADFFHDKDLQAGLSKKCLNSKHLEIKGIKTLVKELRSDHSCK